MTDNEIKKALKEQYETMDDEYTDYLEYGGKRNDREESYIYCLRDTLDLINRYEAEIERLNEKVDFVANISQITQTIKAEAIKEFAERLKVKCEYIPQQHFTELEIEWWIDNLVKEMTEQRKEDEKR